MDFPILSPQSIRAIEAYDPLLEQNDGDTLLLSFTRGSRNYSYFIDRRGWVIVSIQHSGGFSADYYYDQLNQFKALRMIALNGDTTLSQGGYRFSDIRINGQAAITAFSSPVARSKPKVRFEGSRIIARSPLGRRKAEVTIYSLKGSILHNSRTNGGIFTVDRKDFANDPSQGFYLITWQAAGRQAVQTFFLHK